MLLPLPSLIIIGSYNMLVEGIYRIAGNLCWCKILCSCHPVLQKKFNFVSALWQDHTYRQPISTIVLAIALAITLANM